jgi:hypothetical protein
MPKYEPDLDRRDLIIADEWMTYSYDHFGGVAVNYALLIAPFGWSDRRIKAAVAEKFPHENCYHGYDCCGHYYRSGHGVVVDIITVRHDGAPAKLVTVRTQQVQNV